MRKLSMFVIALMMTIGMFTVLGCGGGGGSSENVTYEGETMPSVIDTTGAVELAKAASLAFNDAFDAAPVPTAIAGTGVLRVPSDPMDMVAFAREIFAGGNAGGSAGGSVEPLAAAESLAYDCSVFTEYDGFGGSRTAEFCMDGARVRITMSADGYDDGDEAMDGMVLLEGTEADLGTIIFRDYFYSSVTDSEYFFADGIITLSESGSTFTVTFNLSMYDYITDEGFWLNNYKVVDG